MKRKRSIAEEHAESIHKLFWQISEPEPSTAPPTNHNPVENTCLSMRQPWASCLVLGIKRLEGRYWDSPHRGLLWIHAASTAPSEEDIELVKNQYKDSPLPFPAEYPTGVLLGCVDVVDCLPKATVVKYQALVRARSNTEADNAQKESVEGKNVIQTDDALEELLKHIPPNEKNGSEFLSICRKPYALPDPIPVRGQRRLWKLPERVYDQAVAQMEEAEMY